MSTKENEKVATLLRKALETEADSTPTNRNAERFRTLLEALEKEPPALIGKGNTAPVDDVYNQLCTAQSLIKASQMALQGINDVFGHCPINSREPYCSVIDIANTLDVAGRLLPFDEMGIYSELAEILKE
ncbi:MAG: hypothetical protein CSA94_01665 [Bacteroidetes bacterium]|nr:MAG: hypothetical protein CSA94_01665 [Bacteroidota bacterium]